MTLRSISHAGSRASTDREQPPDREEPERAPGPIGRVVGFRGSLEGEGMLAFISDLHLSDGTAIAGNVAPETFELVLGEIHDLAEQVARARDRPTIVHLVLLGDIFDLLRTERWFETRRGDAVPLAERPWATAAALGTAPPNEAALGHARDMLDEIAEVNGEALAALRGETGEPPEGVTVRRVYVPGNHDRLYLHDEGVRARVLAALGAEDAGAIGEEGFTQHAVVRPDYGVIARHGHEWDMWNFAGYRGSQARSARRPEEYLPTPIGDVVTTELAARLPYELEQRLLESRLFPPDLVGRIHQRMKRIDDVRPLFASFRWAYHAADQLGAELDRAQDRALRLALDDTMRAMARAFRELPYYQAWVERRREPCCVDATDLLRLAVWGLTRVSAPVREIASLLESVLVRWSPIDAARRGARREDLALVGREEMRFVVYGHTHLAAQIPIRGGAVAQDVYLNTGTYRPGVFRSDLGPGFIGWNRLGYVCLASPEEAMFAPPVFGALGGGPSFVAWSGARSHGAPSRSGAPAIVPAPTDPRSD